jgi:hypothetical protein
VAKQTGAPDRNAALVRIAKAEQHLATAQMLLGHDNEVAYTALHDATEYRDLVIGEREVASDLVHATNIVAAVRGDLGI